ncbi:hypothetical protein F4803DRAFT_217387 [Xylaria telfairii]|nr:hypothetical protein F4803DRAFT_217387 [Xylaria telfairii]
MQSQSNVSPSGEEELRQVAQSCLDSLDQHLFVVGPARSGKSTRLPILLAALSGKKVICVQPDDRVAQHHVDWIQSNEVHKCADKEVTVGYHKDEEEMKSAFFPRLDVTYVSTRWLYRMVLGASFNESQRFTSQQSKMIQRRGYMNSMKHGRRFFGDAIGYVILDEVHGQSVAQELGYIAINAAASGLVEAPLGVSQKTKVICTTAYPENYTFLDMFQLSEEEIENRLIKINTGLAPALGNEVQEQFIPEEMNVLGDYHVAAVKKAKMILKDNKEARILLFMDSVHSTRNIARQDRSLSNLVTVLDLETENGWNIISEHKKGPLVVLATPSFTSRIPVEGVTDVICPLALIFPDVSEKTHKEIFLPIYLNKWDLTWARSHLDPASKTSTMHYMFKRSDHSELGDLSGARFRAGDFIDILLGTIRICRGHVLSARSPMRFPIPLVTAERAFRHLTVVPRMISAEGYGNTSRVTEWIMSPNDRSVVMAKLMDCGGFDRRHAFFLGHLTQEMAKDAAINATQQRFFTTVAVAMVVFDENPILRYASRPGPETKSTKIAIRHLYEQFHLGRYKQVISDSWINAVTWMDIKRRAVSSGSEITRSAREHKSKLLVIDKVPLEAAESKLRFLARMINLDERSQQALCDGSFLNEVEEFNERHSYTSAVPILWESYLYAFQFHLAYVTLEEGSLKMLDMSTDVVIHCDWKRLVVDLFEEAKMVADQELPGFYVTYTTRTYFGCKSVTVIPTGLVCNILDGTKNDKAPPSLRAHLDLD